MKILTLLKDCFGSDNYFLNTIEKMTVKEMGFLSCIKI